MIGRMTGALVLAVGALLAMAAGATAQQYGDWGVTHARDAFDDTDRSFALTVNDAETASLGVKCMGDGPWVIVLHQHYYGGDMDDEVRVRWRFDRNEPSGTQYWKIAASADNNNLYWRGGAVARDMIRQARAATSLTVRLTDPLDGETHDYTFSMMGFTAAAAQLPCVGAGLRAGT